MSRLLCLALLVALLPMEGRAEDRSAVPGALYDVFDMRLHMLCVGPRDGPGVVLEAGLGGNFLDWSRVQPVLAASLRVCSYDRAGAGYSSRTQRPRAIRAFGDELHALVRAAAVPRPFVLVGHSFGGLLSLAYASRFAGDVAGVVLVDSMAPDQFRRFAAAGVELQLDPHLVIGRTPAGAAAYGQPDALRAEAIDLAVADKARVFVFREMAMMVANAEAVRDAGLPRLPARVLVHGDREWDEVYPDGRMERTWTALQSEMAASLGAPPPVVVPGTGHQIAMDAPAAVVDAVLALSRPRPAAPADRSPPSGR